MQNLSPEEAIDWVDQNTKQIIGHAKKYLPFAPYDRDDFLQDAYEAALEASGVSNERQISFPACFWIVFKGKISDVTPNPDSKRNGGSHSPPSNFCDWSDFSMQSTIPNDILDLPGSLSAIDIDRVYPLIRQHLTCAENRILEVLFGIHDGPMKIREAARHLECSPPNVRQALNRACSRIASLVENRELNIQIIDGELVDLKPRPEDNHFQQTKAYQVTLAEVPEKPKSEEEVNSDESIQRQLEHQQRKPGNHRNPGEKPSQMASKYVLPNPFGTAFSQTGIPNDLTTLKTILAKEDFIFEQPKLTAILDGKIIEPDITLLVAASISLHKRDIETIHTLPSETLTGFTKTKRRSLCSTITSNRHCRDGPIRFLSGRPPDGHPVAYKHTLLAA